MTILPGLPLPDGAAGVPAAPTRPDQPAASPQFEPPQIDAQQFQAPTPGAAAFGDNAVQPAVLSSQNAMAAAPAAAYTSPEAQPEPANWSPQTGMPQEPPVQWSPNTGMPPEPPVSDGAKSAREVPGRIVAMLAVLVVIIAGGGYYVWHGHTSSGGETFRPPAAAPAPTGATPHGHAKGSAEPKKTGSGHSAKSSVASKKHPTEKKSTSHHKNSHHKKSSHSSSLLRTTLPGIPTPDQMLPVAAVTFAPLSRELHGFTSTGTVEIQTRSQRAQSLKSAATFKRCLGQSAGGEPVSARSPVYVSSPYSLFAGIDIYKSAAAAEQSIKATSSSRAVTCASSAMRSIVGTAPAGSKLTDFRVSRLKTPGLAHSAGLQADFQVDYGATTLPGRFDLLTTATGRATVDYYATGIGRAKTISADERVVKSLVNAAPAAAK